MSNALYTEVVLTKYSFVIVVSNYNFLYENDEILLKRVDSFIIMSKLLRPVVAVCSI